MIFTINIMQDLGKWENNMEYPLILFTILVILIGILGYILIDLLGKIRERMDKIYRIAYETRENQHTLHCAFNAGHNELKKILLVKKQKPRKRSRKIK